MPIIKREVNHVKTVISRTFSREVTEMERNLSFIGMLLAATLMLAAGCSQNSFLTGNNSGTVTGRVLTPGGHPLSGAIVTLDKAPATPEDAARIFAGGEKHTVSTLTAEDGTFAFDRVPEGNFCVRVRKDGLLSGSAVACSRCEVMVAASTVVSGSIIIPSSSGQPVSPPVVYFEGTGIGTLASPAAEKVWTFNLTDVPVGEYELVIHARGFETLRRKVTVDARTGIFEIEPLMLTGLKK